MNAVRAAGAIGRSEYRRQVVLVREGQHFIRISRDQYLVEQRARAGGAVDPPNHRLAGNFSEHFTRQPGGPETGGNDGENTLLLDFVICDNRFSQDRKSLRSIHPKPQCNSKNRRYFGNMSIHIDRKYLAPHWVKPLVCVLDGQWLSSSNISNQGRTAPAWLLRPPAAQTSIRCFAKTASSLPRLSLLRTPM